MITRNQYEFVKNRLYSKTNLTVFLENVPRLEDNALVVVYSDLVRLLIKWTIASFLTNWNNVGWIVPLPDGFTVD